MKGSLHCCSSVQIIHNLSQAAVSEEISAPAHIPDVCGNRRSGTGTSKTGWEAVCRRHVPHRSSYARASTHSNTSRSWRQTSCTPAVSVSHDPGCGRRDVHRKSPLAGKTFPRDVSATDGGNRSSDVASRAPPEYLHTCETCKT